MILVYAFCPRAIVAGVLVPQFCLTLCNPMYCSPPGSSVHRILQAFSRGSSWSRDQTHVSFIVEILYHLSQKRSPRVISNNSLFTLKNSSGWTINCIIVLALTNKEAFTLDPEGFLYHNCSLSALLFPRPLDLELTIDPNSRSVQWSSLIGNLISIQMRVCYPAHKTVNYC